MEQDGAKLPEQATIAATTLVAKLASLGNVSSRRMFGGFGIFESDTMFALIDPEGKVYFKVGDANRQQYEKAGSAKYGRVPYYELPADVWKNTRTLRRWAKQSLAVARKKRP